MSAEFVVSAEKRDDVVKRIARIQDVFGVCVQCECSDPGDSGCILSSMPDSDADLGTVWVHIKGDAERCRRAKEYILSVCTDNRLEEDYNRETLDMLDGRIPRLEFESGAVIERLPADSLRIQGSDENICRAQSLISLETVTASDRLRDGGTKQHNGAITLDVSRTMTANARIDFSDSVTVDELDGRAQSASADSRRPMELQKKAMPLSSQTSSSTLKSSSNSQNKHEDIIRLMQKLGYSRQVVEQILEQIGDQASSNDVLQLLVSLGSPKVTEDVNEGRKETAPKRDVSDGVSNAVEVEDDDPYRPIIIDGSNVAMSYGNANIFDCKGIDAVVMWFVRRMHKVIYVFVPSWRKEQSKPETPIKDQEILIELEKSKILVWTPSRRVNGRRMVCYDDRYILNLALELDGVVVSNDTFRDLCAEKPEYRKVVEERLLMYSFAGDKFMPPDDPLGRHGPSLDNFLRSKPTKPSHQMQLCPWGKKCTYGNKCKYSHPERSRNLKTTSEILMEKDRARNEAKLKADMQARALKTEQIGMPWDKNRDGTGGRGAGSSLTEPLRYSSGASGAGSSLTEPLGYSSRVGSPGSPVHQPYRGTHQAHGSSAATIPLMNPHMVDNSMKTVPLVSSQQYRGGQDVTYRGSNASSRGQMHPQNLQSINERSHGIPDHRMASYHHPNVPSHQAPPPTQHHQQSLPKRSALTAPLPGYPHPHHHQLTRELLTAPLSEQEFNHHYASVQRPGQRYSLPQGTRDTSLPPQPSQTFPLSDHRGDLAVAKDFQHLSLNNPGHASGYDEERVYSYPLTEPYRGSPVADLKNQAQMRAYFEKDEGLYSPHTPVDQAIPSPGLSSHASTAGYHSHPSSSSSNGLHNTTQSRSQQFVFSTPSGNPSQSVWGHPGVPPGKPTQPSPSQQQGGLVDHPHRPGRHVGGYHPSVVHSGGERRSSEPVPPRLVWPSDIGQQDPIMQQHPREG